MNIQVIGSVAKEMLGQAQAATVMGSSRRGVFLSLDCGWIIFLSNEVQHGPLTLNLSEPTDLLSKLSKGSSARVTAQRVSFPQTGLLFAMDQAQVWSAPPRPPQALPANQRKMILAKVIEQAMTIRKTASLDALQVVMVGQGDAPYSQAAARFYPHLGRLAAQPADQLDPLSLQALLGLGSGLTPSGDDIILGLLLVLNRWGDVLAPGLDRPAFNRAVLALAYAHTTNLSANLIECACQGQADERLVTALDGLISGVPGPETAASLLAGWGNSSGLDALCGMACIINK